MESIAMKWLLTAVILILGWAMSAVLRGVTKRLGRRREFSRARIFQTSVVINAASLVISLIAVGVLWGLKGDGLMVFATSLMALLGVALFASWSMLSNATAAIILFFSAPYRVGDRIRLLDGDNTVTGQIRHMGLIFITVQDQLGHRYTLPNNLLLQKTVIRLKNDTLPRDQKHVRAD
ncbi:mechanosensitive ion channel domain-containing protein [Alcanivorax sediminis]|uniref:Small-conductance mechanosensitive channel n=1 Tax=Alcanivorax sediminis TaxID=2663008 RepID=A0A6N7LQZ9_9GAMM|nr:mechanosensitive ion channel domain-containing protein [Alcanivorax sediminis]MQX52613.1 mechanosensitive ion channel [Alcanivorax sediminis]